MVSSVLACTMPVGCKPAHSLPTTGSSRGRGSRAAGWFQNLLTEKGDRDIANLVLGGGIAGWAKGGAEFTEWMDEYDAEIWHKD